MTTDTNHTPAFFDLGEPTFVEVQVPGKGTVQVDPDEANEVMVQAQTEHGENSPERWRVFRQWMADRFGQQYETITLDQAYRFFDFIVDTVAKLEEERKKKRGLTASSQPPTPGFPQVSPLGPSDESEPGSETSTPSDPSLPSEIGFSTLPQSRDDTE